MDQETEAPIDEFEALDAVEDEEELGDAAAETRTQNLQLC